MLSTFSDANSRTPPPDILVKPAGLDDVEVVFTPVADSLLVGLVSRKSTILPLTSSFFSRKAMCPASSTVWYDTLAWPWSVTPFHRSKVGLYGTTVSLSPHKTITLLPTRCITFSMSPWMSSFGNCLSWCHIVSLHSGLCEYIAFCCATNSLAASSAAPVWPWNPCFQDASSVPMTTVSPPPPRQKHEALPEGSQRPVGARRISCCALGCP
mmetsp:Transcript_3764/g.9050  ORF Transcript_3764/g.9050 Transcript_3764/m.9050 type:complete len:211 (-) Transcript_3764:703-1335(-)